MSLRTSRKTVTFARPFVLGGADEVFPGGEYEVETDEELIEGISFVAYRRVATFLHLRPQAGLTRMMIVNPAELDAALARDLPGATGEEQVG
jgi:hypothetical protein